LIVAAAVLLLAHVPPVGVLARVVVVPTHAYGVPDIAAGSAFELNDAVIQQLGEV
jgi:hypothetical protein